MTTDLAAAAPAPPAGPDVAPLGTPAPSAVPAPTDASSADPIDLLGIEGLLGAEQITWRDRVRGFVAERVLPTIEDDFERGHFRRELVPELGALGVLGMQLSGYGCAGADAVSYGLACMELEAGDSAWRTFVSVQGALAMSAIAKFGAEVQRERWLPGLATGQLIGCFGLTEPGAGSNPAAMTTYARRDGDDWVLDGRKRWIGMGSVADVAVVWARVDEVSGGSGGSGGSGASGGSAGSGGFQGFLVPTDTPGFAAHDITSKLSLRASVQSDLVLDGCRLPADAALPGATGLRAPFTCLNEARYGIVWGVLGAARACLAAALGYAGEREVFDKPLAGFQLTQAKLADMAVEYQKGLLLALHLGRSKDAGQLAPAAVSVGKLNNVREALEIARTARTVLGGEGVTSRFPVMRHMANLESVRTYEGTDEVHTLVIGHALTGVRAFA